MTDEQISAACQQLRKSMKGREALVTLRDWFNGNGLSLDGVNKNAVLTLLQAAWENGKPGTVLNAINDSLSNFQYGTTKR